MVSQGTAQAACRMQFHFSARSDFSFPSVRAFGEMRLPDSCSGSFPSPTLPSADFRQTINSDSSLFSQFLSLARSRGTWRISQGKIQNVPHVNAGFIKHTQSADGGLRRHVPARPGCTTPRIRFLFVAPCFRIGLPPDPASRQRPCPSPSLRLRFYLARGLSPRSLCTMPGTHVKLQRRAFFSRVCWKLLCTPGMGVNLWGESPLYMNPVNVIDIGTSTSRRQGRNREGPSKGSRSAKL